MGRLGGRQTGWLKPSAVVGGPCKSNKAIGRVAQLGSHIQDCAHRVLFIADLVPVLPWGGRVTMTLMAVPQAPKDPSKTICD